MPLAIVLNQTWRREHFPFVTVEDVLVFSEELGRVIHDSRTSSDTASMSESVHRLHPIHRNPLDNYTASDYTQKTTYHPRSLSTGLVFSENVVEAAAHHRSSSDTFSTSDAANRVAHLYRVLSEHLAFSEVLLRALHLTRHLTDTEITSDSVQRGVGRTAHDTEAYSEAISRHLALLRDITDAQTLFESLHRVVHHHPRSAADTETITEHISKGEGRIASDTTIFNESIARLTAARAAALDILTVSEYLLRHLRLPRHVADTYNVTELIRKGEGRTALDEVELEELASRLVELNAEVYDLYEFLDLVTRGEGRVIEDTESVSDYVSRGEGRVAVDNYVMNEFVNRIVNLVGTCEDDFTSQQTDFANSRPILLTHAEKQFLSSIVQMMFQDDSIRYYNPTLLPYILDKVNNMPEDNHGINIYDRYGYHHYKRWIVDFNQPALRYLQAALTAFIEINGWYGRPTVPGNYPPTTQVEIAFSLDKKLRAANPVPGRITFNTQEQD